MRRTVVLLLTAALAAACDSAPAERQRRDVTQLQTINSIQPQPAPLDPPPVLLDEMPPPKPKVQPWETPTPIVLSPEDEKLRSSLPFSPAIAMDPVDGDKISIRANTPTVEFEGRIYYFASEANKRMFMASPKQYLTGRFTQL